MKKYRAPDLEPPPVVDAWLADISAQALAVAPLLAAVLLGLWWLSRTFRRNSGARAERPPQGPGDAGSDSHPDAPGLD